MVSHGSESRATTVLPSGKKDNDYEIDFNITVTDALSAAAKIMRKVKASKKKPFPISPLYSYSSFCFANVVDNEKILWF